MRKVLKYRWAILAAWIIAAILFTIFQPNLKQILNQKGEVTIGDNAPSQKAAKMLEGMADSKGDSLTVIFNDENKLSDQDMESIKDGLNALNEEKNKLQITSIMDPFSTPDAKGQLISEDQTTLLVQLNYEKGIRDNQTVIDDFNNAIKDVKVKHYITGELAVTNDYLNSVAKGVDKSGIITIAFILIVLILMFRSVITPLVSLISVGVSYLCSMGIIGVLINLFNFPITSLTQMFVIIVLFGIGTDYHILLFNRYKEELGNGLSVDEAIVTSYKTAGRTIFFSGLTVFMGFASLSFVQFPIYRSANAVAIGIAVLLIEMLTLTPLLMKLLSGKLFWPSKHSSGHKDSKLWERVTSGSVKHPVISLIVIALILSPIIILNSHQLSFDSLKDLSSDNPSVQGFNLVKEKFGAGKAMLTTVVIRNKDAMDNNETLAVLDNITEKVKGIEGVSQVLSPTQPKGEIIKDFYTNQQTKTVVNGLSSANSGVGKIKDGLDTIKNNLQSPDFSQVEQLSAGSGKLLDGMNAVSDGLTKVQMGIDQGADGAGKLSEGIAQLKTGVSDLNKGLSAISGRLTEINTGYAALGSGYKAIPESIGQLKQLVAAMQGTVAKIDAKLPKDTDVATMKGFLEKLSASLDQISSGMNTANENYDKLTAGLGQLNDGIKTMINSTGPNSQLVVGINRLEKGAADLAKGLKQGSAGQKMIISSMVQLKSGQQSVKSGQDALIIGLGKLGSRMSQLKDGVSKSSNGLEAISDGIVKSSDFLTELTGTGTFYIPKEAFETPDMTKMLDAYMSKDRKTAKFTVILDYEPYSDKAIDLVDTINKTIGNQIEGTKLSDAEYGVAGVTAHSNDLRRMATHDITFTEVIVLLAIFILLVIIIKSFWIPLYVVGSLVAAYYTSLSAVAFISRQLFSSAQNGLSWNVPFFSFIAITSLGVDYSIFLLRRFREYPELKPRDAIVHAAKNIGGVVISAAIILSGTFATLYPSNLIVLMELAIGVVIGLLLLSFILLPIVIPALISITGKVSTKRAHDQYTDTKQVTV
jgi:RND superfamily putative drug exporter